MKSAILTRIFTGAAFVVASAVTFAAPAFAQDNASDWRGWHAGAHIGATWGEFDYNPLAVSAKGRGGNVMGGGQLGYNWQDGRYVYGIEADISAIDVRAKAPFARFEEDWMSTIRGRLGLTHGDYLPYLSVGVAFTDAGTTIPGFGSRSGMRVGLAAGAGVEIPWSDRWSWRIEYLYANVPHDRGTIGFIPVDSASDNHTFRLAVNYDLD